MPSGQDHITKAGEPHRFTSENQPKNPGAKKGSRHRSTIVKQWLEATTKELNPITNQTEDIEQQDLIVLAMIKAARAGDVRAFAELMDSAYGKMVQAIDTDPKDKLQAPALVVYNTAPPMLDKEPDDIEEAEIVPPETPSA